LLLSDNKRERYQHSSHRCVSRSEGINVHHPRPEHQKIEEKDEDGKR
jgi:hypothetical protein